MEWNESIDSVRVVEAVLLNAIIVWERQGYCCPVSFSKRRIEQVHFRCSKESSRAKARKKNSAHSLSDRKGSAFLLFLQLQLHGFLHLGVSRNDHLQKEKVTKSLSNSENSFYTSLTIIFSYQRCSIIACRLIVFALAYILVGYAQVSLEAWQRTVSTVPLVHFRYYRTWFRGTHIYTESNILCKDNLFNNTTATVNNKEYTRDNISICIHANTPNAVYTLSRQIKNKNCN